MISRQALDILGDRNVIKTKQSSNAFTNPEITLKDAIGDSGTDYQFEKGDFNSSDSEFDAKEKKELCKKNNSFIR